MADDGRLEQVQQRLIQVARQIEQLSRSATGRQQFFSELITQLTGVLSAVAGVVWLIDDRNQLGQLANVGLDKIGLSDDPLIWRQNQQLLAETLGTGEAKFQLPQKTTGDATQSDWQRQILFVAPLQLDDTPIGVVQIFQRPELPPPARPGHLQYIEQMAAFGSRFLTGEQRLQPTQIDSTPTATTPGSPPDDTAGLISPNNTSTQFWNDLEQFILRLQRTRELAEIAATAAEHSRYLLGVDRVSVAYLRGRRVEIHSVGSTDDVNLHANLLAAIRQLIDVVLPTGEPLISTGKKGERPAHVETALGDFMAQSRARLVMVVPLFEPPPWSDDDQAGRETSKTDAARQPIPVGALVIENATQTESLATIRERAQLLADHVAASLTNARRYQQIFLLPVWRSLGKSREWFRGRKLALLAALSALAAVITVALVSIPADYRVEATGRLMPVQQSDLFAPWDGQVVEVLTKTGKWVDAGQPLLRIENDDLQAGLVAAQNEALEHRQRLAVLQAQIDQALESSDRVKEAEFKGEQASLQIQLAGTAERVELLKKRIEQLTLRASMAGVVTTFQIEQLLAGRQVRRGELLIELANDRGDWQLELDIEERRMGHILAALNQSKTGKLPVEFVLATVATEAYQGELNQIATRTETSEQTGNIVPATVELNGTELGQRRIGAEVSAKIDCGQKSLGYVLFGDVIEFCQRYFWW